MSSKRILAVVLSSLFLVATFVIHNSTTVATTTDVTLTITFMFVKPLDVNCGDSWLFPNPDIYFKVFYVNWQNDQWETASGSPTNTESYNINERTAVPNTGNSVTISQEIQVARQGNADILLVIQAWEDDVEIFGNEDDLCDISPHPVSVVIKAASTK